MALLQSGWWDEDGLSIGGQRRGDGLLVMGVRNGGGDVVIGVVPDKERLS